MFFHTLLKHADLIEMHCICFLVMWVYKSVLGFSLCLSLDTQYTKLNSYTPNSAVQHTSETKHFTSTHFNQTLKGFKQILLTLISLLLSWKK